MFAKATELKDGRDIVKSLPAYLCWMEELIDYLADHARSVETAG